jgi:L-asparaginase/Glu-tRNA(Gln) amidotransferase subunit D
MSWPPRPDERPHPERCEKVTAWLTMLKVVGRLWADEQIEGIVSGGAPGADTMAREAAEMFGWTIKNGHFKEIPVPSGSDPFWKRAKDRNSKVVAKAGLVIALFGAGPRSPGTTDTVTKALEAKIPVHIWHEGRWQPA